MTGVPLTGNSVRLVSKDSYKFYKKKNIPQKHKLNYKEFSVVARMIWQKTAEGLVNSVGGVMLDKFGYLAHWMTPEKKVITVKLGDEVKVMSNFHTDMKWYNTTLFTNMFSKNILSGWSMDKTFSRRIKKARHLKLKTGFKYKCFYTTLRTMYSRRFTI